MTLIRQYWLEFLVAVFTAILMLVATAFRDVKTPRPAPPPRSVVQPTFLLEIETPRQKLRVGVQGELGAGKSLTQTQWIDLREAVSRLKPQPGSQGAWKLRFFDQSGAHEVRFEPDSAQPEQRAVVEQLRLLGLLKP